MKFKLTITLLSFLEILTILFLLIRIKHIKKSSNIDVVTIKKKDIILNNKDPNKSCYEFIINNNIYTDEQWLKNKAKYTINSDGLNEVRDYSTEKPKSLFRIITLGDSFTFGQYVNTSDNWTEILEEKLNKYYKTIGGSCNKIEIINLGVPGYDIDCAAERYKKKGVKYNPNLIFWYIKSDDFQQIRKLYAPMRDTYILNLKKEEQYDRLISNGTIELNNQVVRVWNSFMEANNIDSLDYQIKVLEEFAVYFKKKTVFFNFKKFNTLEKQKLNGVISNNNAYYSFVDYANKYNLNSSEYTNLPYDAHFNAKGNLIIANELFNYLTQKSIISCEQKTTK